MAFRRLIERAWLLYVLAVGLTLVMLPLSELLKLPWAEGFNHPDLFHGVGAHSASLHG